MARAKRGTPWWQRMRKPRKNLDGQGREQLDPVPLSVPGPGDAPLSIQDQIKQALRSERLREAYDSKGLETFEEADDFDIEDEEDWRPFAPWEEDFETELERVRPDDDGSKAQETPRDEQSMPEAGSAVEDKARPAPGQREGVEASDQ
jgi:hypothetical protein